jgi:hypothetical protein
MDRNDVQLDSAANCLLFFKPFAAPAETGVSALPRKQSAAGVKRSIRSRKQRANALRLGAAPLVAKRIKSDRYRGSKISKGLLRCRRDAG